MNDLFPGLSTLRRGRNPNCSSGGMVVGMALISVVASAAVLNAWAGRYLRWVNRAPGEPGEGEQPSGAHGIRLRDEDEGAILEWPEPRALLYLDRTRAAQARAAGAQVVGSGPSVPGALRGPTEVHVAVTERCDGACRTCYRSGAPAQDPPRDELFDVFDRLAALGVFEVPLGGGEVLLREDLVAIAAGARARGLTPNITTSGRGLDLELARALRGVVGQVNVSLDGPPELNDRVREPGAWSTAIAALDVLARAGVPAGVNTVLTRPLLSGGALPWLGEEIVKHGVIDWQWLRLKPSGRALVDYDALVPGRAQARSIWPQALSAPLPVRFDCAMVPFLVEHSPPLTLLRRMGITGCPGAHSLWSRSVDGGWAPCCFALGVPRGTGDWERDPVLLEWRHRAAHLAEPCASCEYAPVCRGGCRIVADHRGQVADPECPRVIEAARQGVQP